MFEYLLNLLMLRFLFAFCGLFFPIDIESISLKRRKSEKHEALNVSLEPPFQVRVGPYTPAAPSPGLTGSQEKVSKPRLVQETTKAPMPTDDFIQRMPTQEAFEPTQAPTYEASSEASSEAPVQPAVPGSKEP